MLDSIWWLFFALIAGVGIFLSIALLTGPAKPKPGTKPLVLVMLLFSTTLIQFVILWSKTTPVFPHLDGLWQVSNYWYGPLLFCFFFGEEGWQLRKRWPHFILGLIMLALWLPYGILSTEGKLNWLATYSYPFAGLEAPVNNVYYLLKWWASAIHQSLYAAFFIWVIYKQPTQFGKLHRLISQFFLLFVVARITYFILRDFAFFNPQWDYAISLTMSYCIFRIGMLAFHRPDFFFFASAASSRLKKYATSPLSSAQSVMVAEKVRAYIEQEKAYLDAELRLPGLAKKLNLSSHQVSQAINEAFHCSFPNWINQYRIEHACELLKQKNISAKEVGYQSGYNNLTTFYQVFKKEKGMTPANFRNHYILAK